MFLKDKYGIIYFMREIMKHIKEGTFARAYLLYGAEDYLKRTYKNKLRDAICGDDDMNFSYYQGKETDLADIEDTSRTMPFFAERRLIMIEDSGFFKSSSQEMADIVKNAPDTTFFVFVENEVDKRNRLYKTVNETGYVCEMKTQTQEALMTWAAKLFGASGKKITRNDMSYFIEKAGLDMNTLFNEAQKLISYSGDREVIEKQDIDEVIAARPEDRVFDMINAMSAGKTDRVIQLYGDLLALKEPPMKILALIGRQFSQLLAVKDLQKAGAGNSEIAQRLGIRPFFMGRYASGAGHYTEEQLRQALEDCVCAENDVKSGKCEDKYAVELLLIKYSTCKAS